MLLQHYKTVITCNQEAVGLTICYYTSCNVLWAGIYIRLLTNQQNAVTKNAKILDKMLFAYACFSHQAMYPATGSVNKKS